MDVTIYSKPNCPQCEATKRKFTKEGVAFREVDVSEDKRAFMRVRDEWGYQRVPVIEVRGEGFDVRWDGFRPDRMKAVIDEFNRLVALSVEAGHDVDEDELLEIHIVRVSHRQDVYKKLSIRICRSYSNEAIATVQ